MCSKVNEEFPLSSLRVSVEADTACGKDVVDSSLWEVCWVDRNWHIDGMSAGGGDPVLQFVDHWIS